MSLFDDAHIVEVWSVDDDIELECRICKTKYYTKNMYYIGYSDIYYEDPEDQDKCKHVLKYLRPTGRRLLWETKKHEN